MSIKLENASNENLLDFLIHHSSQCYNEESRETYLYMPYWLKYNLKEDTLEFINFEKIPEELKEMIKKLRNDTKENKNK